MWQHVTLVESQDILLKIVGGTDIRQVASDQAHSSSGASMTIHSVEPTTCQDVSQQGSPAETKSLTQKNCKEDDELEDQCTSRNSLLHWRR